MKLGTARHLLLWVFAGGLLLNVGLVFLRARVGMLYGDEIVEPIVVLMELFSIHLSVILGGIFAQRGSRRRAEKPVPAARLGTAVAVSALWVALVTLRLAVAPLIPGDDLAEVMAFWGTVAPVSTFLVAGVLTYFFARG